MPFIELPDGSKMAFKEAGAGSIALVMVHGYTGGKWYYDHDIDFLKDRYRCLAPDLVGHGDSDKPIDRKYSVAQYAVDIRDFINAAGVDRFVLFGHSMGGMIAQTYALGHDDGRLAGLVLLCTASQLPLRQMIAASVREEIEKYEKSEWVFNEQLQRLLGKSAWAPKYADEHPDEVERAYSESLRVPELVRMKLMLAMADEFDVTGEVGRISTPTLVCVGSEDLLSSSSEGLAGSIPGARFVRYDGAGHMLNIEAVGKVQEEINAFLTDLL